MMPHPTPGPLPFPERYADHGQRPKLREGVAAKPPGEG
jgi:hypothetical protein